ncbi:hypothetical protein RJ639_007708, partial [Escallonia herrerae]
GRNMSWQAYVDEHLMCDIDGQGQHLTAAAIIGEDGSVWAQSASFPQLKPEEITGIITDFAEPGHLAPTGLHIGGVKYMVIQGEPGAVIRGKKGSGGITVKKTGQALVFGIYEEPVTASQCNMVVESHELDAEWLQQQPCEDTEFWFPRFLIDNTECSELHLLEIKRTFKPEEITAIMNDFSDPGSLAPTGLYLGGTKYMVIQGEAGAVVRGKKGPGGVTVKKTNMALIIGVYDEPMTPGQCNMILKPEEITSIMTDFAEPGHLAPSGWHIGGVKYMGSEGITVKKTGQALVFGIYEEPVTASQCNMVVERLGDYLIDRGL